MSRLAIPTVDLHRILTQDLHRKLTHPKGC
jgi:hypothetical protein